MVTRLLPEQITEYWNIIKFAVENSLPPIASHASDRMNKILESLINETMQCWIMYEEGEVRKLQVISVTTVLQDYYSEDRSVLIYSIYGFTDLTNEIWTEAWKTVSLWGKSINCQKIIAYTDVQKVKDMAIKFGGDANYTLLSFPL
jgi:hypothetical protein